MLMLVCDTGTLSHKANSCIQYENIRNLLDKVIKEEKKD